MNKNLISQNPVQRFKLGKQIQKFKGGNPIWFFKGKQVETTNVGQPRVDGQPVNNYENNPSFQRYDKVINTAKGKTWAIRDGKYYDPSTGKLLNSNQLIYDKKTGKKYSIVNGEVKYYTPPMPVKKNPSPAVSNSSSSGSSVGQSKNVVNPTINYGERFNNFVNGLTDEQKLFLQDEGVTDLRNTKAIQDVLLRHNLKIGSKTGKADGYWGDRSQEAFDNLWKQVGNKYQVTQKKPVTPELSGMNKVVVDWVNNNRNLFNIPTPYRTSNTYENTDFSDRLKAMGIKSNADLIDFGWRTNGENYDWKGDNWAKQFRSDINQALGGDWSDQNIRKVFNTQGKWRGSRVGDFSDIQGVLQNNAGKWNGTQNSPNNQIVQPNNNYTNYLLNRYSFFKKNGGLLSRNPVTRFKKGGFVNFRIAAQ